MIGRWSLAKTTEAFKLETEIPVGGLGQRPTTKGQRLLYATFLNTSAEFFDPNAMQLHTACSIAFLRPTSGT